MGWAVVARLVCVLCVNLSGKVGWVFVTIQQMQYFDGGTCLFAACGFPKRSLQNMKPTTAA
jgi:hypothetical protein